MVKTQQTGKFIKNSRGMISADFIFSLTLCAGLCLVLFALTFTLSMSEVAQYIAFSTARAHAAAHTTPDKQMQMGLDKFNELLSKPVLKDLFAGADGNSWFVLGPKPIIRNGLDGSNFSNEYPVSTNEVPLTGVRIQFKPKLLNMKIAFLGSTSENPDEGFSAYVTSFIFREPTQDECWTQVKARNTAILSLSSSYSTIGASTTNKYIPMEDNGC